MERIFRVVSYIIYVKTLCLQLTLNAASQYHYAVFNCINLAKGIKQFCQGEDRSMPICYCVTPPSLLSAIFLYFFEDKTAIKEVVVVFT